MIFMENFFNQFLATLFKENKAITIFDNLSRNEQRKILNYALSSNETSSDEGYKKLKEKISKHLQDQKLKLSEESFKVIDLKTLITDQYNGYGKAKNGKEEFISNIGSKELKENLNKVLHGGNYHMLTENRCKYMIYDACHQLQTLIENLNNKLSDSDCDKSSDSNFRDLIYSFGIYLLTSPQNSLERTVSLWILGLTKKGFDNIIGTSNKTYSVIDYCKKYINEIDYTLKSENDEEITLTRRLNYIKIISSSSLSLAIRGSMKSMTGKLLERLILGLSLSSFNFTFIPHDELKDYNFKKDKVYFWLSDTEEKNGREKDATIIYNNKAINIDIGLIGIGNPEIASDKLTRYRSQLNINNKTYNAHTIVIVAFKNSGQTIDQAAKESNTDIISINNNELWTFMLYKKICTFFEIEPQNLEEFNKSSRKKIDTISISSLKRFANL